MIEPKSRILFASVPLDGHFNPLTSLAIHLKKNGHDVRWYNSSAYQKKVESQGIPFYPFKKALEIRTDNLDELFPERAKQKSQIAKLKFDIKHAFILRGTEYYEDIQQINKEFPFDILVADNVFTGIPFVKDLLKKPVIAIGVLPLTETSKDLPPAGLGMTPSYSPIGKIKQRILRYLTNKFIFNESKQLTDRLFDEHGVERVKGNVFDVITNKATLVLQSGTPGFDYYRSDLSKNVRFIGPLLPTHTKEHAATYSIPKNKQQKLILVTQGTVEKDPEKIIVPVLEAFKGDDKFFVVVTTGGSGTEMLRKRFPQANILIEDYIPFNAIMPQTDVYVSNGGYGGVMFGIKHAVPMVVAGLHEGKNEICARVGYFKLGVNLKTELPKPAQIKLSVTEVLASPIYKSNVKVLSEEFNQYHSQHLFEKYVEEIMTAS